jgi:hypothetical protein
VRAKDSCLSKLSVAIWAMDTESPGRPSQEDSSRQEAADPFAFVILTMLSSSMTRSDAPRFPRFQISGQVSKARSTHNKLGFLRIGSLHSDYEALRDPRLSWGRRRRSLGQEDLSDSVSQ